MHGVPHWLYAVNGWAEINGQWVDVRGLGFRPETIEMEAVPVSSLVGQNIAGRRAIVTNPVYWQQYPNGMPIVTLKRVIRHKDKRGSKGPTVDWIRIEFEPASEHYGCGFSGWVEEGRESDCLFLMA